MSRLSSAALMATATFVFAAGSASAATTACSTVAACVMGTNSSSGPGVGGTSSSGFGLSGISKSGHGVNGTSASSFGVVGITTENATSTSNARAGVLGEDLSTNSNGLNSGVSGTSSNGYGVYGHATKNGIGVYGSSDAFGAELVGGNTNATGFALWAIAANGTGVLAESIKNGPAGTFWVLNANQDIFQGQYMNTRVVSIDASGNEILAGSLTTSGSPKFSTHSSAGADVASFGARTATPSIEDIGKTQLRGGAAYVALDRTFASTIDPRVPYSVFLTPEGDSNSLYTTQLSSNGFAVRESKGGHSTLIFDYRIVAKPLDEKAMHLPTMNQFPQLPKHVAMPKAIMRTGAVH